jgi:hypothetical protein
VYYIRRTWSIHENGRIRKEKKIGQKFTVEWKNEYDRMYVSKDKALNKINLIEKKQFYSLVESTSSK